MVEESREKLFTSSKFEAGELFVIWGVWDPSNRNFTLVIRKHIFFALDRKY